MGYLRVKNQQGGVGWAWQEAKLNIEGGGREGGQRYAGYDDQYIYIMYVCTSDTSINRHHASIHPIQ